jgi:2-dehydro-3-deoxyphosphogluconate aldolase / (4S)-4-hydroxy-2-oxoglutarate aldolase
VNLDNTPEFIHAGAVAVAVGGELVDLKALREGKPEVIADRVRQYIQAIQSARASMRK